jgi:hypothetical protein
MAFQSYNLLNNIDCVFVYEQLLLFVTAAAAAAAVPSVPE